MRVKQVRVRNYRSVHDSRWFDVEPDKTVLVGPNEAGKTAVLRAMQKVAMPPGEEPGLEPLRDYPRRRYHEITDGEVDPSEAVVAEVDFELDDADRSVLAEHAEFLVGAQVLRLTMHHANNRTWYFPDKSTWVVFKTVEKPLGVLRAALAKNDEAAETVKALDGLIARWSERTALRNPLAKRLDDWLGEALGCLDLSDDKIDKAVDAVREAVRMPAQAQAAFSALNKRVPFFVYFSNIFRVRPRIHLAALASREEQGDIDEEYDFGNLCLLRLLGFTAQQLADFAATPAPMPQADAHGNVTQPTAEAIKQYQDRVDERQMRLNSAAVRLTEMIREVWGDEEMTLDFRVDGQYLKVVVRDELGVEVELDQRSEGFQWLVSFFVVFTAQAKGEFANAILLLDEPGLSLHGLKQKQFRLTVSKLAEKNQTLFTTHSPFMVGTNEMDKVRVVEMPDRRAGTLVHTDFAVDDPRSLFPLQAHFGYELGQTLFGQHRNLVVEGITDFWYLEALNEAAVDDGVKALDDKVTILPAGDAGKVVYHATVLHAQDMKVGALFDSDNAGLQASAQETFRVLMKDKQILMVGDFYDGKVTGPEFEDLLRDTLLTVAKAELSIDTSKQGGEQPTRSICDLLADVGGDRFSKLRLAKAFLRWMRTNGWSALTDTEQQSLTALFTAANKATK